LLVASAFTSVPTPLYPVYQQRDGLTTLALTSIYAVYALGVLMSLLLLGHVSDWYGRRRLILPGLLLQSLAAVVFVVWSSMPGLILGRILTGLGFGLITSTAAAHLTELHAVARPMAGRGRSNLVAAAASMGGFAVGPLLSGLLGQYAVAPLRTPYLVFLVLLLLGCIGVLLVPETVPVRGARPSYRPQRVSVPGEHRGSYFAATGVSFTVLAVLGLFASLGPTFIAETMHRRSPALAGAVVCLVMSAAFAAQLLFDRRPQRGQIMWGLVFLGGGLLAVTVSVFLPSLSLFLVGGVVTGAGGGPLLKAGLATVIELAPPGSRGESLAGFYFSGYLGLALPVLGLGLAAMFMSVTLALVGFTSVMLLMLVVVGWSLLLVGKQR